VLVFFNFHETAWQFCTAGRLYSTIMGYFNSNSSFGIIIQNHFIYIMWLAGPLLGNDREISSYTTAVAR
jgi:hypothetical protein